jgi:hypothetical protein
MTQDEIETALQFLVDNQAKAFSDIEELKSLFDRVVSANEQLVGLIKKDREDALCEPTAIEHLCLTVGSLVLQMEKFDHQLVSLGMVVKLLQEPAPKNHRKRNASARAKP